MSFIIKNTKNLETHELTTKEKLTALYLMRIGKTVLENYKTLQDKGVEVAYKREIKLTFTTYNVNNLIRTFEDELFADIQETYKKLAEESG